MVVECGDRSAVMVHVKHFVKEGLVLVILRFLHHHDVERPSFQRDVRFSPPAGTIIPEKLGTPAIWQEITCTPSADAQI